MQPKYLWTTEQIESVKQSYSDGATPGRIGAAMGRTRQEVLTQLRRNGLATEAFAPRAWDKAQEGEAIKCVEDGFSAAQVGRHFGISRNAVIGRLHRLGIGLGVDANGNARKKMVRPRQAKSRARPRPTLVADNTGEPEPLGPVANFPPRHTCQWTSDPIESGQWRMCGHPVQEFSAWCPYHWQKAHQQTPPMRVS